MSFKRASVALIVAAALLCLASPAQAAPASTGAGDETRMQPRCLVFCAVLAVRTAIVIVRVARTIRASRAAAKVRRAGKLIRAVPKHGVKATRSRVKVMRSQARRVAARGKNWLMRNGKSLKGYSAACLEGIAALELVGVLKDDTMHLSEWRKVLVEHLAPPFPYNNPLTNSGFADAYYPQIDISKKAEAYGWACASAMAVKGAKNWLFPSP